MFCILDIIHIIINTIEYTDSVDLRCHMRVNKSMCQFNITFSFFHLNILCRFVLQHEYMYDPIYFSECFFGLLKSRLILTLLDDCSETLFFVNTSLNSFSLWFLNVCWFALPAPSESQC